jgi:hypothetical protein
MKKAWGFFLSLGICLLGSVFWWSLLRKPSTVPVKEAVVKEGPETFSTEFENAPLHVEPGSLVTDGMKVAQPLAEVERDHRPSLEQQQKVVDAPVEPAALPMVEPDPPLHFDSLLLASLAEEEEKNGPSEQEILEKIEKERSRSFQIKPIKQSIILSSFQHASLNERKGEEEEIHFHNSKISHRHLKIDLINEEEREVMKERLSKVKEEIHNRLTKIYNRYEFNRLDFFHSFLLTWNIPARGWDILKYKFMKKILSSFMLEIYLKREAEAQKMEEQEEKERAARNITTASSSSTNSDVSVPPDESSSSSSSQRRSLAESNFFKGFLSHDNKIPEKATKKRIDPELYAKRVKKQQQILVKRLLEQFSSFVLVFTGSGTTAGTDNHYKHSHPAIIEREFTSLLTSFLKIPVYTMNIAQENVHCELMAYCFESLLPINITLNKLYQQQVLTRLREANNAGGGTSGASGAGDSGAATSTPELDALLNTTAVADAEAGVANGKAKEILLKTYVKNIPIPTQFETLSEIDFISWENSYYCLHRKDNIELMMKLAATYRAVIHFSSSASYIPFHCMKPYPKVSSCIYFFSPLTIAQF